MPLVDAGQPDNAARGNAFALNQAPDFYCAKINTIEEVVCASWCCLASSQVIIFHNWSTLMTVSRQHVSFRESKPSAMTQMIFFLKWHTLDEKYK